MARTVKNLPVRNEFLLMTNGKRSEKSYFEKLRSKFQTIYKIKVKFMNDDPVTLVNHAIAENTKTNRVWCVFDKDEFPEKTIYQAIRLARKNEIGVAFSNMAFEVWLIDHFYKCEAEKTVKDLCDELDSLLKENGYVKGYDKSDIDVIMKMFMPRLQDAIQNAEIIHQKRILDYKTKGQADNNYPVCRWNSYTDLHKLVEAMKLQSKN